jgi:hypothetical protein
MQLQTYQEQKWQIVPTVCVSPLPSLQAGHMCEIQRLMGCLLFVDRAPDDTPYADLLCGSRWDEVAHEFARQACSLMGQVRLVELPACPSPSPNPPPPPPPPAHLMTHLTQTCCVAAAEMRWLMSLLDKLAALWGRWVWWNPHVPLISPSSPAPPIPFQSPIQLHPSPSLHTPTKDTC